MGEVRTAPDERVKNARVTGDAVSVDLMDGRTITVPLAWYPRLAVATPDQRENWEVAGAGFGIHWPDLNEDLSTEGLLRGAPVPLSVSRWIVNIRSWAVGSPGSASV